MVVVVVVVVVVVAVAVVLAVVVVGGGGGGGGDGGGGGVTPAAFFLGSVVRESSNRWCFRVFLQLAEQKNIVNTNVFGGSEAQNHGIYDVFCLW